MATGFWRNNTGPSTAFASVNSDGTVSLVEGSPDIGGTRVVAAMHMAEVLTIPVEDVHPQVADTDSIGYTSSTGGSSVAFKTGWACYEAAQDIKQQMIERAATIWDVDAADVELKRGSLSHSKDPELSISFRELAGMLNATGGPIVGRASVDPRGVGGAFAVNIVDVEVDPETGKVQIFSVTPPFRTLGKAVHPSYVEGQIQGGVVQGIGWALNEEYFFDNAGAYVQLNVPRLPDAHLAGPADDRHGDCGGAESRPSFWRARRGRGAHRPAHGGDCQRHPRRRGRPHDQPAHVAGQGAGGDLEAVGRGSGIGANLPHAATSRIGAWDGRHPCRDSQAVRDIR